jgi:hypothetical protein
MNGTHEAKKQKSIGNQDELLKKRYLNELEVASVTGISVYTLRNQRFLRRGFPYFIVGIRSIRYKTNDVITGMEARRVSFNGAAR